MCARVRWQMHVVVVAGGVRCVCCHRVDEQLGQLFGEANGNVTAEPTASRVGGALSHRLRVQHKSNQPTGGEAVRRRNVQYSPQFNVCVCAVSGRFLNRFI